MIRRDLQRYHVVVRDSLRRLKLDGLDAHMLVHALLLTELRVNSYRYLWDEVEHYLAENRGCFKVWTEESATSLVRRLKQLHPGDAMAILDAVEVFWQYDLRDGWQSAMIECGLTADIMWGSETGPEEPKDA